MLNTSLKAAARAAAFFIGATLATPGAALAAATFSISPLKLSLPANKLAAALTIGNQGSTPVTVQAELVAWSQDNGDDAYAAAGGLIVSPPIFTLAPGAKQVVRVGRAKRAAAPVREQAFRLVLAEVPPAGDDRAAVSTVIQVSLPVFVPPASRPARPDLRATVGDTGPDLRIDLENAGPVHDKVTRLALLRDGKVVAEKPLNFYVLAGAKRQLVWTAALPDGPAGIELELSLDGRKRSLRVPLPQPSPAAKD